MTRQLQPSTRPAPARGMTLVDMMVGGTIGLFLVAVMGAVYTGSKTTFVAQEASARMQENGRYAVDTIAGDLRMSGFRGCGAGGALVNTLNSANTLRYNFGQPIWGSRSGGGGWQPALEAPVAGLSPSSAGDVLFVRRTTGQAWSLIGQMADPQADLPITATANFRKGDLLVVSDCGGGAVFQATNDNPGTAGAIAHDATTTGLTPGLATSTLGRAFANDAVVWRLQTVAYYLAPSERRSGQTALWSFTSPVYDGSEPRAELVTGVERMGITFGIDSNADSAADRFVAPGAVADWSQVVSARVELVLVASDIQGAATASMVQPYVFNGTMVTPTDKRLRTVMSALVSLRNALP